MRLVTGFAALLTMTSQPLSASAGEVFVTQVAAIKASATDANTPTGGTSTSAMLATPLPLNTLSSATPAFSAGEVSNVAQIGSNNFAAVTQTGAANQSAITQRGTGNTALVTQRGGTH